VKHQLHILTLVIALLAPVVLRQGCPGPSVATGLASPLEPDRCAESSSQRHVGTARPAVGPTRSMLEKSTRRYAIGSYSLMIDTHLT
jgi:hypothetical protein